VLREGPDEIDHFRRERRQVGGFAFAAAGPGDRDQLLGDRLAAKRLVPRRGQRLSQVVVGLVFSWFYLPREGLLNGLLTFLGMEPVNVLGDPDLATYGIIAAGLWPQTAYCMILYLTGLNAVDPEQVEAGRLDGAKGWKMLWYVILPQLKPATFIAFVVTIIGALRSFDLISIMTNGGPFGSTRVLSFYMFEKALSEFGFRMGYGSAIAVVLFLIMLVFIGYFLWQMWYDEREARR